jgi:O-antigen ligase
MSLVAAGLVFPLSPALKNLALGVAVVAWLLGKLVGKTPWPRTRANLPLALWGVAGLLSMAHSVAILESLKGVWKLLRSAAIFFAVAEVMHSPRRIMMCFRAVMVGAALVSLDGLVQVLWGHDVLRHNPAGVAFGDIRRLTATFHHANDFGLYGVGVLPICLVVALRATSRWSRWWGWGVVAGLGLALVLTFSRPAALGVAVSLAVFLLLRRAWRTLAVLGLLAGLGVLALPGQILEWSTTQASWIDMLAQPQRPQMWWTAMKMIEAHPILGVGINTFVLNYPRYKAPGDEVVSAYAHNQYLHLTAELGLIGLAAFGLLLFRTAQVWRWSLRSDEPRLRLVALGLGCGLIGFLTAGLLESALQSSHTNLSFWLWLGMLHALARRTQLGQG